MDVQTVVQTLKDAFVAVGVFEPRVLLDFPDDVTHGDFTTNAALVHAKEMGVAPRDLAQKVVDTLPELPGISQVTVAGPGFINLTLSHNALSVLIEGAQEAREQWGEGSLLAGKTVMVEHTQPNPFKVFHIGHLMSNTIGESLVRLLENQQARVVRANYQGDVGPHIAKAIWGIQALDVDPHNVDAIAKAYAHGAKLYEESEQVKGEIDAINAKVYEQSDGAINAIYDAGKAATLQRFDEIYRILGSNFDRFYFESETAPRGAKIVEAHPDIFPVSEGTRVFKGEEYGLHTRVFITSKGFPTYEAKELGLETLKAEEYPECDEFVITTAVEQKGVFEIVKKALEFIDAPLAAKLSHVTHGMMMLPTGKMSSRTGDVITGESILADLIDAAQSRAKESRAENPELLAQQIAVAAIKFQVLKQATGKDAIFDKEKALSLEGDTGPYLQYTYARARSVLHKAHELGIKSKIEIADVPNELLRTIVRFPAVAQRAAFERAPHHVANYLLHVAGMYNSWYANEQFLDGTEKAAARVALTEVVMHTIRNGLQLLGIEAPERM